MAGEEGSELRMPKPKAWCQLDLLLHPSVALSGLLAVAFLPKIITSELELAGGLSYFEGPG